MHLHTRIKGSVQDSEVFYGICSRTGFLSLVLSSQTILKKRNIQSS